MFKVYLNHEDFIEFKKGIFDRTEKYFKSIIENIKSDIDISEYEYFYTFLLPSLIELDYYHFSSARAIYKGIFIKDPFINLVKKLVKESCKKVFYLYKGVQRKDKKNFKNELRYFYYKNNINKNTILSLSYFHRHKEYLDQIINNHPIVEIAHYSINNFSCKINSYRYGKNFLKITPSNFYEEQLIDNINFFLTYRKLIYFPCKLLLFSTHGWANSNFSTLLISYVSSKIKKPIIAVQTGFNHQSCICVGQVIWERYVSSKYATWGDPISKKDFKIGSMYANKSIKKNDFNYETLILPQVPFSNVPRCFSSYWTLTYNDFNSQISKLEDAIENILSNAKSPVFRIKHCDLKYYSKNIFSKFKNIKVDYGNINKSQNFKSSRKNFIFYMSTAIIQSVNAGSETYGIFSPNETLLEDNFKKYIAKDYPFDCNDLAHKLCYCPSVDEYTNNLSNLIKKLLKL